jgi:hypothetical protein
MNYSLKLEQLEIGKCYQNEGYRMKFILLGKTERMFGQSLKIFCDGKVIEDWYFGVYARFVELE